MSKRNFFDPHSQQEWFRYYLYNDHDYLAAKKQILSALEAEFGSDYPVLIMLSTKDPIIAQLERQARGDKIINMIKEAANRFEVSARIIELGLGRNDLHPRPSKMPLPMLANGELIIKIGANTRLKDIEKIWFMVQEEQKQLPDFKPKSQSNYQPALIYAIYKARLPNTTGQHLSFEKIFKLYQEGNLPGYKGSTTQYTSSDSLERAYNKYKPEPDTL